MTAAPHRSPPFRWRPNLLRQTALPRRPAIPVRSCRRSAMPIISTALHVCSGFPCRCDRRLAVGQPSRSRSRLQQAHERSGYLDPRPDPQPKVDITGLNILCLDDDPLVLEALGVALRARGCIPWLTATANAAITRASAARPAAGLIDFHLGNGRDGLDVAEALRRAHPGLAIALITADNPIRDDVRFGASDVTLLPKPVDPAQLWQWLQTAARADAGSPPTPL